ncbi:MAG TPA: FAD-dependent oxidoreductase [Steroidobacteraceae bacterium]|nr:FAD-dependent oxidoreductase [Steroidobacteraceae bacterium]
MLEQCDFLVIGGGIAGASVGFQLARHGRVIVLEMEDTAGYHASGRSAAFFHAGLGEFPVQVLTEESRAFLEHPPEGFTAHELVTPLPLLTVARAAEETELRVYLQAASERAPEARYLCGEELRSLVPMARIAEDALWHGVLEPRCSRIDGHALLQGFLAGIRANKGTILTRALVERIDQDAGRWKVVTPQGRFAAPVLIDAAGAWGDEVAALAGLEQIGLAPLRRTVVIVELPDGMRWEPGSFVHSLDESFYFVPESGGILLSPQDETPVDAHDVQPEELDVATAIARFEAVTSIVVKRVRSQWAGLRTFARDRLPVVGFDERAAGFFWCVGQGGFGLQTAPMLSQAAAALILRQGWPAELQSQGVSARDIAPQRLRTAVAGSGPLSPPRPRA